MGPAGFDEAWMPGVTKLWDLAARHSIEPKEMLCVDVANRHLVIFPITIFGVNNFPYWQSSRGSYKL